MNENKWQLIETAPKDEDIILGHWFEDDSFWLWISNGFISPDKENEIFLEILDKFVTWTENARFYKPTHWQPLSAPPENN